MMLTVLAATVLLVAHPAVSESPSPCSLPAVSGRCDAVLKRFAFYKDSGECREFTYGGCGGNANNFRSLSDCETACIPSRTVREATDDKKNCNKACPHDAYLTHYTELGCQPVYGPEDECCPIRYDCSNREVQKADKCYHEGREYNIGDDLPDDTTPPCLVHCQCRPNHIDQVPRISCVSVECPELFMGPLVEPNCVRQYTRNTCCSTNKYCAPEGKTLDDVNDIAKCEYDGHTYIEGQKFYPEAKPCMTCLCQPGFTGKLEEPHCRVAKCNLELHYSHYLRNKCVPVYYEDRCCPIDWRCPSDYNTTLLVPPASDKSMSMNASIAVTPLAAEGDASLNECVFGEMRLARGETVPQEIAGDCVRCSCAVPPVLTCVKNYNNC